MYYIIALVLSLILCIADFITEHLLPKKWMHNLSLASFSAGVAVSYILLRLLPEFSQDVSRGKFPFLFLLFGFVLVNIVEKYAYLLGHNHARKKIVNYHRQIHLFFFFMYNLLIGIVLVLVSDDGLFNVLLFYIPFLLYIIVEIIPQEFAFETLIGKIGYSFAPLIGTGIGILFFGQIQTLFDELLGLITGTLLYIVIRESVPHTNKEKLYAFLAGIATYSAVILITWTV